MILQNLKVGTRLYLLISFVSVLLIAIGGIGVRGIGAINDSMDTVTRTG